MRLRNIALEYVMRMANSEKGFAKVNWILDEYENLGSVEVAPQDNLLRSVEVNFLTGELTIYYYRHPGCKMVNFHLNDEEIEAYRDKIKEALLKNCIRKATEELEDLGMSKLDIEILLTLDGKINISQKI